jgi:hypothetical protein
VEQTYTVAEVAKYYRVDERTIRRRISGKHPTLGHLRCDGRILFKQKHLEDYDRRHEVKAVI